MGKKFNVGDKVKVVVSNYSSGADKGAVGVIAAIRPAGFDYEVKFDREAEYTHHGDGHSKSLYRWYYEANLELVEEKTYTTKYKPGDEVTVRSDLTNKAYYMADGKGYMTPTYQMLIKRGKKVKIKSVTKTGKYMIEGSVFPWVDEMFVDETKVEPKTYGGFKLGDRVETPNGVGTVIAVSCNNNLGVEHDEYMGGHTCSSFREGRSGKNGHCWYHTPRQLTHITEEPKEDVKPTGKKYKVGDHVKVKYNGEIVTGVIRCTKSTECYYGVEMDDPKYGIHDCSGFKLESGSTIPSNRGKWVTEANVIGLVEEPKPVEEPKSDSHKFKVGQRIKMIATYDSAKKGMTGVIIELHTDSVRPKWNYGVKFDQRFPGGHGCHGKCKFGYGQWVSEESIELLDEKKNDNWKVVITPDGDKTTLEYFKDGMVEKTVTVNRFSEDEYSANAAIKAVVDKLMLSDKIAVTVKFNTGRREYTYLTDDSTIGVDDVVVVPAGCNEHNTLATVTKVTPFLEAKIPVPISDLKYVIKKSHHRFKVGDKVVAKTETPYCITTNGWKGVVTELDDVFGMRVSESSDKCGYYVKCEYFDLLEESPKETEPKYYNGKVVCVKTEYPWWKVGKIYEVKDGRITADDGDRFPKKGREPYRDADDVRHAGCGGLGNGRHNYANEFIPVVE